MQKLINEQELMKGCKIQHNDIINYDNSYYVVKDDMQNCFICPFEGKCNVVNCHAGFDLSFEPISEIEAIVLTKGVM